MALADDYPVHAAVFQNDARTLQQIKDVYDCSQKDKHGLYFFGLSNLEFLISNFEILCTVY